MPMFIRALPSLGKTWLATNSTSWVDGDDLLVEVAGDNTKEAFDKLLADKALTDKMRDAVKRTLEGGQSIAANFDGDLFGFKTDLTIGMEPDEYIEHIKRVGRTDLLESFDEETLRSWAAADSTSPVVQLRPGGRLSDLLNLLRI